MKNFQNENGPRLEKDREPLIYSKLKNLKQIKWT